MQQAKVLAEDLDLDDMLAQRMAHVAHDVNPSSELASRIEDLRKGIDCQDRGLDVLPGIQLHQDVQRLLGTLVVIGAGQNGPIIVDGPPD